MLRERRSLKRPTLTRPRRWLLLCHGAPASSSSLKGRKSAAALRLAPAVQPPRPRRGALAVLVQAIIQNMG